MKLQPIYSNDAYAPFRHLWSSLDAEVTVTRKELRPFLIATGGSVFFNGSLYDIKAKHIGAGVYRVTKQERKR